MADHIDSRAVLWASVRALMIREHGKENINQFHKRPAEPPQTEQENDHANLLIGIGFIAFLIFGAWVISKVF